MSATIACVGLSDFCAIRGGKLSGFGGSCEEGLCNNGDMESGCLPLLCVCKEHCIFGHGTPSLFKLEKNFFEFGAYEAFTVRPADPSVKDCRIPDREREVMRLFVLAEGSATVATKPTISTPPSPKPLTRNPKGAKPGPTSPEWRAVSPSTGISQQLPLIPIIPKCRNSQHTHQIYRIRHHKPSSK